MDLIHPDSPLVRRVLAGVPVATAIARRDEMLLAVLREHDWDFAVTSYFERGLQAWRAHQQIVRLFLPHDREIDVLDFAAGFGRATRFLAMEHGAAHVWVSDIQQDALAFQQQLFGVNALLSSGRPEEFSSHKRFACVTTHSFFSHTPPHLFAPWLTTLNAYVEAGGILVFSVHDESLLPLTSHGALGITFRKTSETDRIDVEQYGSTWVSKSFVESAVATACPGKSLFHWPRGLANFQDLYVVYSSDRRTGDGSLDQGPFGYASICREFGNQLDMIGWVSHWNPARKVSRVVIDLGEKVIAEVDSFFPRRDVVDLLGDARHLQSGWHARFELPAECSTSTDVLAIRAVSDLGNETFLFVGTIAGLMLQSARAELRAAGREAVLFLDQTASDPLAGQYESS